MSLRWGAMQRSVPRLAEDLGSLMRIGTTSQTSEACTRLLGQTLACTSYLGR